MDRDINAAENILFLLKQHLGGNQRPILFMWQKKLVVVERLRSDLKTFATTDKQCMQSVFNSIYN